MTKKGGGKKRIAAIMHGEQSRPNIPTAEMEGLVAEEEARPVPVFYPRNKDLDPQLVWTGKDAENAERLHIDAVPIYVQEKISPQAIIDDLRRRTAEMRAEEPGAAANLFADFNGLPEDAKVEFYKHSQKWTNRMILGDSLMVMASLAHKEGLRGKVQCVYMDPPYGIKFSSNWQPSTKSRAVKSGDETAEPEVIRAFRDTWKLGIHSYLSYMRDRLIAARDLLTESGSVFVQISDENVHLVRSLMDEVFGRENFVSMITYKTTSGMSQAVSLKRNADYLIWYTKNLPSMKFRRLYAEIFSHRQFSKADGERRFRTLPLHSKSGVDNSAREFQGKQWTIPSGSWRYSFESFQRLVRSGRIVAGKTALGSIYYEDDFGYAEYTNNWTDTSPELDKSYVVQTSEKVIQRCILMTTDPGDLVLDPTCGSGTTASVAEKFGRRWITIDSSRVALTLARARLMGNCYDYFLLQDSEEGAKKEAELSKKIAPKKQYAEDVQHGFVYERAPHITLRAIANNKEIDEIDSRHFAELNRLRKELNAETGNKFAEWEIPAAAAENWNENAKKLHSQYISLRRKRQKEIDDSISRNAEMEMLVDRPYKAKNIVRVSGPFTMESLSPHRILPTDSEDDAILAAQDAAMLEAGETPPAREARRLRPASETENETRFVEAVFEHLKSAGVQNTRKEERLKFTELEIFPGGDLIHFAGRYEQNGREKKVAVCVGPEYGTVTRSLIVNAAREAADLFDMLVVLGFAFEAHADENLMQLGRLPVWRARMNSDLHMATRLAAGKFGNLFIAFGEPDIQLRKCAENGEKWEVEICGVDIFDPTTGDVKSSGVEEIACWMIDTDYNGQSFCARHAYFCKVGKDPYEKLKRTLKAEISPETWETMRASVSRPFPAPAGGKIAVKVINHYGDEVMKVFPLSAAERD